MPGCLAEPATAAAAAWGYVALATLLAAAAAFAAGTLRERLAGTRALREARAGRQQALDLEQDWAWECDAAGHLLVWQGPGRPAQDRCVLFELPELRARLEARRAFDDLSVHLAQPLEGERLWMLRGVPRRDDTGRHCGFAGRARPADVPAGAEAAAAALPPLLALQPAAALVALDTGAGWSLLELNAAAQILWPQAARGQALEGLLAQLAPAVRAAVRAADAGAAEGSVTEGWRLTVFALPARGARGLVLAASGAAAPSVPAAPAPASSTAERDTFIFTISHDLRAPIRVVEGFTRIVKEDYGRQLDRVGNDHLDRVLGAAARMNLMIDALMTLARLSSHPLAHQPVNLSQLAGYVLEDLRRGSPEREADIDIDAGLVVQGDPTLLRVVLENLLGNAWKYSARCKRAQISLRSVAHGATRAYVVRDNGAGFDMRSADRLFGLFQRLHSASEFAGHGVGLASVQRIVRRHGGEIWAEAEAGRGAAFFFTLPP